MIKCYGNGSELFVAYVEMLDDYLMHKIVIFSARSVAQIIQRQNEMFRYKEYCEYTCVYGR